MSTELESYIVSVQWWSQLRQCLVTEQESRISCRYDGAHNLVSVCQQNGIQTMLIQWRSHPRLSTERKPRIVLVQWWWQPAELLTHSSKCLPAEWELYTVSVQCWPHQHHCLPTEWESHTLSVQCWSHPHHCLLTLNRMRTIVNVGALTSRPAVLSTQSFHVCQPADLELHGSNWIVLNNFFAVCSYMNIFQDDTLVLANDARGWWMTIYIMIKEHHSFSLFSIQFHFFI